MPEIAESKRPSETRIRYLCILTLSWIAAPPQPVESKYSDHAGLLFRNLISKIPPESSNYGIGYAIVHDCGPIVFILLDYYQNENELVRHLYSINKGGSQEPIYHTPSGLSACVWEGEIINFERRKWMEHILKQHDSPQFELYLKSFDSGEV